MALSSRSPIVVSQEAPPGAVATREALAWAGKLHATEPYLILHCFLISAIFASSFLLYTPVPLANLSFSLATTEGAA